MKKLKAIIVDDEKVNIDNLLMLIDKFCPNIQVISYGVSVQQGLDLIEKEKPDILFLDVEMPDGSGFTLLDKIKEIDFHVVICTAHLDYAIKAIKSSVIDYLLKPIDFRELREAVLKVETLLEKQSNKPNFLQPSELTQKSDKIALSSSNGVELFLANDILRFQANKLSCIVYFTDGTQKIVSKCLKEYEEVLSKHGFFRLHKSHMVNMSHVTKYISGKGGAVLLTNGEKIEVAVRRKKELLEVIR